jgi:hypothetical protein
MPVQEMQGRIQGKLQSGSRGSISATDECWVQGDRTEVRQRQSRARALHAESLDNRLSAYSKEAAALTTQRVSPNLVGRVGGGGTCAALSPCLLVATTSVRDLLFPANFLFVGANRSSGIIERQDRVDLRIGERDQSRIAGLRRRLAPFGVRISSIWGDGYALTEEAAAGSRNGRCVRSGASGEARRAGEFRARGGGIPPSKGNSTVPAFARDSSLGTAIMRPSVLPHGSMAKRHLATSTGHWAS